MNQDWLDPVFFALGPLQFRWYGLLYVLSFLMGGLILRFLTDKKFCPLPKSSFDRFATWIIVGLLIGARLGYVLIYNWEFYSANFLQIFWVWKGGLSFHGAILGMFIATFFFAKREGLHFFQLTDSLVIASTPGILLGRIGNFINGELYGRVTDSWFGMIFPGGGPMPRHPSQIYEGVIEGCLLFALLWYVHRRQRFYGVCTSFFILGYSVLRLGVEFFREPDPQIGYILGFLTMGQLLSLGMLPLAWWLVRYAKEIKLKPLNASSSFDQAAS